MVSSSVSKNDVKKVIRSVYDANGAMLLPASHATGKTDETCPSVLLKDLLLAGKGYVYPSVEWTAWRQPMLDWDWEGIYAMMMENWAERLRDARIQEAVAICIKRYTRDTPLLLAAMSFWDPASKTFAFPKGEITVTLEDMVAITGLRPYGDHPWDMPEELSVVEWERFERMKGGLEAILLELNRASKWKVTASKWLARVEETWGEKDEAWLAGCLVCWLCNWVFGHQLASIKKESIVPGIRLAMGYPLSLGGSALANLYNGFDHFYNECLGLVKAPGKQEKLFLPGAGWILQIFLWERFPEIAPSLSTAIEHTYFAYRWMNKKGARTMEEYIADFEREAPMFRPYSNRSDVGWRPAMYEAEPRAIESLDGGADDAALLVACTCSLAQLTTWQTGVNVEPMKVLYNPHWVARQFGFDQWLPGRLDEDRLCYPLPISALFGMEIWIPGEARLGSAQKEYSEWVADREAVRAADTMTLVSQRTPREEKEMKKKKKKAHEAGASLSPAPLPELRAPSRKCRAPFPPPRPRKLKKKLRVEELTALFTELEDRVETTMEVLETKDGFEEEELAHEGEVQVTGNGDGTEAETRQTLSSETLKLLKIPPFRPQTAAATSLRHKQLPSTLLVPLVAPSTSSRVASQPVPPAPLETRAAVEGSSVYQRMVFEEELIIKMEKDAVSASERALSAKFREWVEAGVFSEPVSGPPCPELSRLYPDAKPALRMYGEIFSKIQPKPSNNPMLDMMREGAWCGVAIVYMDLAQATINGLAGLEDGLTGLMERIARYESVGFKMEMARAHLKVLIDDTLSPAIERVNVLAAYKNEIMTLATRRAEMVELCKKAEKEMKEDEERLARSRGKLTKEKMALEAADIKIASLGKMNEDLLQARAIYEELKKKIFT